MEQVQPADRQRLLLRLADLVERDLEEFAALDTLDMGAPITRTRAGRQRALGMLRFYAGMATALHGETIENSLPVGTLRPLRAPWVFAPIPTRGSASELRKRGTALEPSLSNLKLLGSAQPGLGVWRHGAAAEMCMQTEPILAETQSPAFSAFVLRRSRGIAPHHRRATHRIKIGLFFTGVKLNSTSMRPARARRHTAPSTVCPRSFRHGRCQFPGKLRGRPAELSEGGDRGTSQQAFAARRRCAPR